MDITTVLAPLTAAAIALTGAGGAATPDPSASAAPPAHTRTHTGTASLADIQARAAKSTAAQIDALTSLITSTTANTHLSDDDRAKALAILNDDKNGITTLQAAIAADTTAAQARTDDRAVETTYRVHQVALPEVRIATRVDDITSVALPKLVAAQQKLTTDLAAHPDKSTSALTDALADLGSQLSTAQSDANGLSGAALALSPAVWAGDHDAVSHVRAQASTLEKAVKAADKDAATVRKGLRG